jgi:hypothetical protein
VKPKLACEIRSSVISVGSDREYHKVEETLVRVFGFSQPLGLSLVMDSY